MALPAAMPPPLSPKEPRRSNRRSVPSTSTSTSKSSGSPSPDSPAVLPQKEPEHAASTSRSTASSSSTSGRARRVKDELDDTLDDPHHSHSSIAMNGPPNSNPTKRNKRKPKDKSSQLQLYIDSTPLKSPEILQEPHMENLEEDEDAGVTRCVCSGHTDDDADAGEFMIQCEMCKVWQHGSCMGFPSEDQAPQGDYYCEVCKPEDHGDLLKKLQKRQRQGSAQSHYTTHRGTSRSSRSHSPTHPQKLSKRRNTMNSRDAAYEESLQEVLGASAAEAAIEVGTADDDDRSKVHDISKGGDEIVEEMTGIGLGGRRKRKRTDEESIHSKRKRSASSASEHPIASVLPDALVDVPMVSPNGQSILPAPLPLPPPTTTTKAITGRVKRGGARKAVIDSAVGGEGDEGASNSKKHPNQYTYRGKLATAAQLRRAPPSYVSQASNGATHEHGTRRSANNNNSHNQSVTPSGGVGSATGFGSGASAGPSRSIYYHSNVPLQPLFTSWSLPDYLAHLQSILPSDVPAPLVIRAPSFGEEGDGATMTERGVKVKWPAKRMSVTDMNKRVRALVEWVGREQAGALERDRRKSALERALATNKASKQEAIQEGPGSAEPDSMLVDSDVAKPPGDEPRAHAQLSRPTASPPEPIDAKGPILDPGDVPGDITGTGTAARQSTEKMMEELMEELINFQERFGPGAKGRAKDRASRTVVAS